MKDKLKIGIIGTRGIPNRYGGFEAFAGQVSERLAAKGHEITVYCSHNQAYREPKINDVNLVFIYNPEHFSGTAGQFFYDLGCNLHARRQSFDVILHLGYTSDSVWTWLWSRRSKHITNMDGMEWMRSKYPPAVQSFLKKAEQFAANGSSLLIADSTAISDYLVSKYKTPVRFISYGAEIPTFFDPSVLIKCRAEPKRFDLVIARMEPENNIEMAIRAKLDENTPVPLLILSNDTRYGTQLKRNYRSEPLIRFLPADYNPETLNSLRHFARYYIHGHSVGGTNPSLLEAMACGCQIVAHNNLFNKSVLGSNAGFYANAGELATLLKGNSSPGNTLQSRENNLAAIREFHNWDFITNEYESAFYQVL